MRARSVSIILCACAAALSFACEKIIHYDDFRIGDTIGKDAGAPPLTDPTCSGLASQCLTGAPGLRHPPCAKASDAPDTGDVYVYAWRRFRLGANPNPAYTMDAGAYDPKVGYDLDCSDHSPSGLPVLCAAQALDAGALPWQIYPGGIDNAISQRLLGPINVAAYNNDPSTFQPLDDRFSSQLELGHGSVLTVVYNWNGTPNDPVVSVRSVSGLGIVGGGNPKWDGTDKWIAATDSADPNLGQFQIPKVNSSTDTAYVADGVLVSDFSFLKPLRTHIVNNGNALEVPLYGFHMIGDITKDKLSYAQAFGRWALDDFIQHRVEIAAFLSSCDPLLYGALKGRLEILGRGAADLPIDQGASKGDPCNAISTTWAADAERASIGAYEPFPQTTGTPCQ